MRVVHRFSALLVSTTVGISGLVVIGADAAEATPPTTLIGEPIRFEGDLTLNAYTSDNSFVGFVQWNADPDDFSNPGDAILADDEAADGYGINAHLSDGRAATTAGDKVPNEPPWVTGSLPEDTWDSMYVCLAKGSASHCSSTITVSS